MHLTLTQAVKIDAWLRLPFDKRKQKCPFDKKAQLGCHRECYSICATAFPKIAVIARSRDEIEGSKVFTMTEKMIIKDCPCSKHTPKYVTERVKLKLKS